VDPLTITTTTIRLLLITTMVAVQVAKEHFFIVPLDWWSTAGGEATDPETGPALGPAPPARLQPSDHTPGPATRFIEIFVREVRMIMMMIGGSQGAQGHGDSGIRWPCVGGGKGEGLRV
jgi:hypothetical protein